MLDDLAAFLETIQAALDTETGEYNAHTAPVTLLEIRNWARTLNAQRAALVAAHNQHAARTEELTALLRLAHENVCSLSCPSVWRTDQGRPPHSDRCRAITAVLAEDGAHDPPTATLIARQHEDRQMHLATGLSSGGFGTDVELIQWWKRPEVMTVTQVITMSPDEAEQLIIQIGIVIRKARQRATIGEQANEGASHG